MLVHAAGESSPGNLPDDTHAVVLVARDELQLALLADKLEAHGLRIKRVREPDAPYNGALMAIGIAPAQKEAIRRLVSSVPLLK